MRGAEQPEDSEKQCLICRASWHPWVFLHFLFDELRCGYSAWRVAQAMQHSVCSSLHVLSSVSKVLPWG